MTAAVPLTAGIDISKASLDIHILPTHKRLKVANTAQGHQELILALTGGGVAVKACVFESTGHYGRDLHHALHAAGLPVMQVNPRQASYFLKSHNPSHKTDRGDARALAAMAEALPLRLTPPPAPEQEALRELMQTRQSLIRDRVAMAGRIDALSQPALKEGLGTILAALEYQIKAVDKALDDLMDAHPALAAKAGLIETVPGLGRVAALAILAFMPEIGAITGRQAAALAGVAPKARDSGIFKGKRSIHGGRTELRNILYMAAMTAMRCNPAIRKWLEGNNMPAKPHKVARIATVRKLLVILNAMLKKNKPWQNQG